MQRIVNDGYFEFEVYTTTEERLYGSSTQMWLLEYDLEWGESLVFKSL